MTNQMLRNTFWMEEKQQSVTLTGGKILLVLNAKTCHSRDNVDKKKR